MLPEHHTGGVHAVFSEGRGETPPFDRNGLHSADRIGIVAAGQFEESRHEIGDAEKTVAETALVADTVAPRNDHRGADAAFVNPAFITAERRAAEVRPLGAVTAVSVVGTERQSRDVARVHRASIACLGRDHPVAPMFAGAFDRIVEMPFVRGAVVRQKDNQRVVQQAAAAQFADDLPHAGVHLFDHRGINLHTHLLPLLLRFTGPVVALLVLRGQLRVGREYAQPLHPFEPFDAQRIPAGGETPFIFSMYSGRACSE